MGVLLTQASCVTMVMAAANAHEVEDRLKLKLWYAKDPAYAECETPIMIAPVIYHDFDQDMKDELVVVAASCMTGTAGPDIHMVLTPRMDGDFTAWEIPEITRAAYDAAAMEGNRNYRLSVAEGMLVATWRDRSDREEPPLRVRYTPVAVDKQAFAVYDIVYGK